MLGSRKLCKIAKSSRAHRTESVSDGSRIAMTAAVSYTGH